MLKSEAEKKLDVYRRLLLPVIYNEACGHGTTHTLIAARVESMAHEMLKAEKPAEKK